MRLFTQQVLLLSAGVFLAAGISIGAIAPGTDPAEVDVGLTVDITPPMNGPSLAAAGAWYNPRPDIPPACYRLSPRDRQSCGTCHAADAMTRDLPEPVRINHWSNLSRDTGGKSAPTGDVSEAGYSPPPDQISALRTRLRDLEWVGTTPDLSGLDLGDPAAFSRRGLARDGSGWVAYRNIRHPALLPFEATTTQNAIRLPKAFRHQADGQANDDLYLANIALLLGAMTGVDEVSTAPLDETDVGVDLDGSGELIVALSTSRRETFIGGAAGVSVREGTFPLGTEFLQILRYAPEYAGEAPPIREIRYLQKTGDGEARLERPNPAKRSNTSMSAVPAGLPTGSGWRVQGFIEDPTGALRPQTQEELASCTGCHGGLSATTSASVFSGPRLMSLESMAGVHRDALDWRPLDSVFSFAQMFPAGAGLGTNVPESSGAESGQQSAPSSVDARADAADALALRAPLRNWLDTLSPEPLDRESAETLNARYRGIVAEQSFVQGRTPTLRPGQFNRTYRPSIHLANRNR
ncbi:MAG: hypothetical protein AAFV62_04585 [Pseudomonadota bacterium]